MNRVALTWRGACLLPAGALAVHQLRYWLWYGPGADHALASQGHGYLDSVTPVVVVFVALGLGGFIGRLASAARSGHAGAPHRYLRVWIATTLSLVAIYASQELLEGIFSAGHRAGIAAVFAAGGFSAIPVACAVAAVIAWALRGCDAVVAQVAKTRRKPKLTRPTPRLSVPAVGRLPGVRLSPLAFAVAGRAPPPAPRKVA